MNEAISLIIMIVTAIIIFTTLVTILHEIKKVNEFGLESAINMDDKLLKTEINNTPINISGL